MYGVLVEAGADENVVDVVSCLLVRVSGFWSVNFWREARKKKKESNRTVLKGEAGRYYAR